jgi:hypothetical protein
MRPKFRIPSDETLTTLSDMDLRLLIAHQKYNVRARRLAMKELRERPAPSGFSASQTSAPPAVSAPPASAPDYRPKGGLADIAWLGVLLGAGALTLHVISWWGSL